MLSILFHLELLFGAKSTGRFVNSVDFVAAAGVARLVANVWLAAAATLVCMFRGSRMHLCCDASMLVAESSGEHTTSDEVDAGEGFGKYMSASLDSQPHVFGKGCSERG
ncbi:hypothetical protein F5Y19DRAFT_473394 [Xylariaceae sp. FL1651]|nr:hypothetical protein F5Y19DRAFT_473394 [Xylariaceae sp. FL1651]